MFTCTHTHACTDIRTLLVPSIAACVALASYGVHAEPLLLDSNEWCAIYTQNLIAACRDACEWHNRYVVATPGSW